MASCMGLPIRISSTSGTMTFFPNSSAAFEIEYLDFRASRTAPMGEGKVPPNLDLPVPQTPNEATENFSWPLGESGMNLRGFSIMAQQSFTWKSALNAWRKTSKLSSKCSAIGETPTPLIITAPQPSHCHLSPAQSLYGFHLSGSASPGGADPFPAGIPSTK